MVKLTRIFAGLYEYKMHGRTFEISLNDEQGSPGYGEWTIKDLGDIYGYSDPIATLRECREALQYMEQNPKEYGLV